MAENKREKPDRRARLTGDIQDFIRKRGIKQEVTASKTRKHVEIQLLISELENLLLNMSPSDKKVAAAKSKLKDIKRLITSTLDLK